MVEWVTNLSNGDKMPIVGLGTWLADEGDDGLKKGMNVALEAGYRHFDTAYIYMNESTIGKVLKEWLDSGKITRDQLFIVTKLPICGMKREKVNHFITKSLQNLQLDYVDLYLVHVPFGLDSSSDADPIPIKDGQVVLDMSTNLEEVWKGMEELVEKGKAKSIGISNFDETQIERVAKVAKIKPSVLQVELHTYFQQKSLRFTCLKHRIKVCAYSPLGSPGRKAFYEQVGLNFQPTGMLSDPVIIRIARKYGKICGQICLRFLVQQGITVIPKSTNSERIKENIQIFDFQLSSEDMAELEALDKKAFGRTFNFNFLPGIEKHPEFPKGMRC